MIEETKTKTKTKNYPIFSASIAKSLINAGCIVKDVKINNRNEYNNRNGKLHEREDFIIFFFEDTTDFRKELTEQTKQLNAYKDFVTSLRHNSSSSRKE